MKNVNKGKLSIKKEKGKWTKLKKGTKGNRKISSSFTKGNREGNKVKKNKGK